MKRDKHYFKLIADRRAKALERGEVKYCICANLVSKETGGVFKNGCFVCGRCHRAEVLEQHRANRTYDTPSLNVWDFCGGLSRI